ncbi:MAG: DUF4388 domain-containing protein [Bradymonadaceae bacterium]|nr:DUF4388 domain-containing protein [Lujinxingiaceae bacterium]
MNRTQTGGYVLKFISGKYQGGEFPLELETEVEIGRGSELDMVLVEDMVSRKHARITTYGGELQIEDFGSTNGTFVNGEKISKARIKEGDRILIGTNIIKLVHRDRTLEESGVNLAPGVNAPATRLAANEPNGRTTTAVVGRTTGATLTGSISGLIEEVPLPDLLQLFSTSRKSGVLVIMTEHDIGKIFLRQGRTYYATINDDKELDPYKAFYRLISWRTGTFSLEQPVDDVFENEIDESIESLMMEGMRLFDEMENLGPDVPHMSAPIAVKKPLVAPIRSLTPELLDTFQLALNYPSVSNILNKSLESDLDTMQSLLHLIRNDFISAG